MNLTLIFICKIALVIYIWLLIVLCIFIISNALKIYRKLKDIEVLSKTKMKIVLHSLMPFMLNISSTSKNIQAILNINKAPKTKLIYPTTFFLFKAITGFESLRLGINLSRRLLFRK